MQSITTRYFGPSAKLGSRVFTRTSSGIRRVIALEHGKSLFDAHKDAAHALAKELGWAGVWHVGALNDGGDMVFVHQSDDPRDTFTVTP